MFQEEGLSVNWQLNQGSSLGRAPGCIAIIITINQNGHFNFLLSTKSYFWLFNFLTKKVILFFNVNQKGYFNYLLSTKTVVLYWQPKGMQTSPHISDLKTKINSPGQVTNKQKIQIKKPTITITSDLNSNRQLPKPGDRSNFNTHKTRWKCFINNERPTGQKKKQLLDGRTVENKGKLILTEIFPSVQKHDI